MNRVWALNSQATAPALPASLEVGYPRVTGPYTTPGPWWYHMVTETLLGAVTAAGLTPSSTDMTQLSQAITIIAKGSSTSPVLGACRVVDTAGTVSYNGLQTIDGVSLTNGDRVLKAATSRTSNGIYIVNSAGAWPRASDMPTGSQWREGTMTEVSEGTANSNTVWVIAKVTGELVTIDTTAFTLVDITGSVKAALGNYLLITDAANTYLTQANASNNYLLKTDAATTYLTINTAASTYLTQTNAANTYATLTALGSYYTKTQSDSNYYSKTASDNKYETIAGRNTDYNYLTGTPSIDGLALNTAWPGAGINGYIYATGNLIAGYSDDRLKTRLGKIEDALKKIRSLSTFLYRPNALGLERGLPDVEDAGMSAQEWMQVMPQAIAAMPGSEKEDLSDPETLLTLRYERTAVLLTAGIQELCDELDQIRAEQNRQAEEIERFARSMRRNG